MVAFGSADGVLDTGLFAGNVTRVHYRCRRL